MKNRNIKIFSFVLCLVAMLFALGLNRTSAETPGVTVSGKWVDTISNIQVSNNEGGNLDWELGQWATFRINATYDLEGKNVKAGDQTTVTVPDALIITSDSFEIRDINTNEIIAHATVDAENKKLTLTYTDYVEKHSDTNGSFFFYARIDFKKHPQQGEIPVEVTVNNKTIIAGKVTFKGVGDGDPNLLKKTSWVHKDDPKTISYTISVNQLKQNIKEVTVEDTLQFTNASYVKDSFRVTKGEMSYVDGGWQFNNTKDVTNEHPVTVGENGQSFVVNLGDISETDQYRITYDVHLNYSPADGEVLNNQATLKGKNIKTKEAVNKAAVQIAGGSGVGYVFTIHIHKVDDANQPLAGAKFKVVRQANNQVIGEYVTDDKGNITVNGLLKDKYILTELQAPEGYTITTADTPVNAEDFSGTDKSVTKTIVNPKAKPKATQATIELDKTLTGRDLTDGEFSFELYEGANKLQTVTNKNGKVTFAPIEYTEEGELTYTVKEVAGNTPGITYDKTDKQVTVKVKKDGDNLKADVAYPDNKTFSNTYTAPQPAKAKISASKILEGAELKNGEFNFQLLDEAGKVLQTKQNAADGAVAFDELSYSSEDAGKTFHYTIKEVIPESKAKGMTYDEGNIDVTVTVTKDDASNTLKASVAYGDKKSFTNKLVTTSIPPTPPTVDKPELKLYNIQLHKANADGNALAGAVFGLFEADGTTPVANPYGAGQATATSDSNGLVTFTGFEAKDYVVKELTAPEGYQLSSDVIKVSASELNAATNLVVDKGTVVNKPFTSIPPTPPTVDKPELKLYSIQLHKVNQEGKALVGAVFGLFEADGTTPVSNPYGAGQATATSDANGLVTFTGLEAKDYVVKELTAPDGYQLSDEVIKILASDLVVSNSVVDKGNVVNKPFTYIPPTPPTVDKPELKLYNIQLHKVNLVGQDLAGAVFGLYEADGVTPVANPYGEGQATATSDTNGLVSFTGLEARDYVIKELTAPAGYQLLTDVITVSASELKAAPNLVVDKGTVINYLTPPNTPPTPPTTPPTPPTPPTTPPTPPTPPTTPPTPPTTPSTDKPKGDKPSGSQPKEDKKHTLPSTGETVSAGLVAAGLALAGAGSMLVAKKRDE
ncbi:SpaA isopeptide-forming pilin-related protein [Streptococcus parasanguinis]|uniref:SpaA isopeptide-forming pilin-related protein n=2 Tax=Streptococcus parasanguinis TaxID=1318 RepID=UPI0019146A1A|nr:SpaA isopeptide-forming pilin-related protein [Streptococcus parasanguinis]MBK5032542.1 LPXTG cell wall anchor domain-containing protein [Streptococcus parasanguinis]MBK5173022.1 LPXTG cell wall anchor domain-containing protein [Streptococcus parasanguinis]